MNISQQLILFMWAQGQGHWMLESLPWDANILYIFFEKLDPSVQCPTSLQFQEVNNVVLLKVCLHTTIVVVELQLGSTFNHNYKQFSCTQNCSWSCRLGLTLMITPPIGVICGVGQAIHNFVRKGCSRVIASYKSSLHLWPKSSLQVLKLTTNKMKTTKINHQNTPKYTLYHRWACKHSYNYGCHQCTFPLLIPQKQNPKPSATKTTVL